MDTTVEYIYLDRNNTIDLVLCANSIPLTDEQISAITRMQLIIDDITIDSSSSPTCFDWTTQTVTAAEVLLHPNLTAGNHKLILSLGLISLTAGLYTATLIVYDSVNTLGIVWCKLKIVIE